MRGVTATARVRVVEPAYSFGCTHIHKGAVAADMAATAPSVVLPVRDHRAGSEGLTVSVEETARPTASSQ